MSWPVLVSESRSSLMRVPVLWALKALWWMSPASDPASCDTALFQPIKSPKPQDSLQMSPRKTQKALCEVPVN